MYAFLNRDNVVVGVLLNLIRNVARCSLFDLFPCWLFGLDFSVVFIGGMHSLNTYFVNQLLFFGLALFCLIWFWFCLSCRINIQLV